MTVLMDLAAALFVIQLSLDPMFALSCHCRIEGQLRGTAEKGGRQEIDLDYRLHRPIPCLLSFRSKHKPTYNYRMRMSSWVSL